MDLKELGSLKARAARAALQGDIAPLNEWRRKVAELVGAPVPRQVRWANLPGLQAQYLAEEGDSPLLSDTVDDREARSERVWMTAALATIATIGNERHAWLQALLFMRSAWELVEQVPPGEPAWRRMRAIPLP